MNKYVWELYLKSGGKEIVDFFKTNLSEKITKEYSSGVRKLHEYYCVNKDTVEDVEITLNELFKVLNEDETEYEYEPIDIQKYPEIIDEAMDELWSILIERNPTEKDAFIDFISYSGVAYHSTALTYDYYECFIPYYFQYNYNVLEIIAEQFDIILPELPTKQEYKKRFYHYGELCKVFTKYRLDNGWSPYELFAFLYDYAPKYIGGIDSYIIKDLPEPKSAFFIGGGGDNGDATAEDDSDSIYCWMCNPETRAGDMIVMYLRTPISAISSIWRSCSIGFNDPFFFYYRCTYIGNPCKVKRLGINQIKKDKLLSQLPIVKKNMQGINGVELMPSEYNYIVDKVKGNVPRLEFEDISVDNSYTNEKDVENRLIKPFLKDLDYEETDYTQQKRIPVGNHNTTLIPDFVLLPDIFKGQHSAFAVLEAKKSIKNEKELQAALKQVSSYALLLSAKYAVVASQERIWITSKEDRYTRIIEDFSWNELSDNDNMYKVKMLLGKK